MTITDFPARLVDEGSGADRAAFIQALIDLAAFYETHPGVPLPGDGDDEPPVLNVRVPRGARGRRLEALAAIAEQLGTVVVKRNGTLWAERQFGPLLLEAHVRDTDFTAELIRQSDARKSLAGASRSAA